MRNKLIASLLIGLVAASILMLPRSSGMIVAQEPDAAIRIAGQTFRPGLGETANTPPGLTIAQYAQGVRGYYIVQFIGPVQASWKTQVEQAGGELLGYIPDYAFKVRMNPAQAARVAAMGEVNWVGIYQPAFKISPAVDASGIGLYQIRVEQGENPGLVRSTIAQSGATVIGQTAEYITVGADGAQLAEIANILEVAWVENYLLKETHNEIGAGVIMGANVANANGYDGSTQTAAVADTGIGGGTTSTAHRDIQASRVVSVYNWPGVTDTCFQTIVNDGAIDVDSAHGTHVAGSVLSSGDPLTGLGRGTAPAASLVFQATENYATISTFCQLFGGYPPNGYFLTGLPENLNSLYQQAYNDGARIHANSWGSAQAGVYTANSAQTDQFIWNNPDMTITFSAGNAGIDANNNGVVDNDSIGSPATAKNVITIGASENERPDNFPCDTSLTYTSHDAYQPGQTCGSMGGENLLGTAGQRWGFTAEPLNSDSTAGNAEQMAPFSSRGPTDDGRIKPDVVAPGTWILSTFSDLYQEQYDPQTNPQNGLPQYDGWGMPYNGFYKYMGGTSMSNPLAAGAATVVRDYFNKAHTHNASAALVKAMLINTAVDLLDENNDGANDNDFPIPNVHEGWGRINVAAATDNSQVWVDNTAGLSTSGSFSQQFNVSTAGSPFKVTLVWSDFPSTEAASVNLVNNLNLVVTAPGGAVYRGNNFSGGWSVTGGSADSINNVENVYVQSAAAGTWTVEIVGQNVPNGPQPFALVVDGTFGAPPPTNTPTATVPPTSTIQPTPTLAPTNTSTPLPPTNTPEPASSMHVGDIDGIALNSGKNWAARVTITVHDSNENPVAGANVAGAWSGDYTGSGSCTTDGSGQCSIDSGTVAKKGSNSMLFAVTGVSHASLSYDSASNHDVDGSSNGTSIQVNKDGTTSNPGATPTPVPPTPTSVAGPVVHVGDLDGSSAAAPRNRWDATVVITVHDTADAAVSNVTVTGSWSTGGSNSCTTNGSGQCTIIENNIKGTNTNTTFTVTGLSGNYNGGANHDPDGDSNGTSITINQP